MKESFREVLDHSNLTIQLDFELELKFELLNINENPIDKQEVKIGIKNIRKCRQYNSWNIKIGLGERIVCQIDWHGVTVLSTAGKLLSIELLGIENAIDGKFKYQQAGIRNGRSWCEQIFVLKTFIQQ